MVTEEEQGMRKVKELKEQEWGLGFTSTATCTIQSPETATKA
jgi:hypothetical protein